MNRLLVLGAGGPFSAPAGGSLLLDTVTGSTAAFSIRKLRSAQTNCLRVRRSSDNAEQDIGFSGNDMDTSSLTSFCSATDGFVVTWYDQSGNARDMTQSTAASQPKIVSSGSIVAGVDGKVSLDFDGSNDRMVTSATLANYISASASTIFVVFVADAIDTGALASYQYDTIFCDTSGYAGLHLAGTDKMKFYNWDGNEDYAGPTIATSTDYIAEMRHESGTLYAKVNNGSESSATSGNTQVTTGNPEIGGRLYGVSPFFNGRLSEIIFYDTALSSGNRSTASTDINTYYTTY